MNPPPASVPTPLPTRRAAPALLLPTAPQPPPFHPTLTALRPSQPSALPPPTTTAPSPAAHSAITLKPDRLHSDPPLPPRRFSAHRVCLLLLLLLTNTYLGSAFAVFSFNRYHQKITGVDPLDFLLPPRWSRVPVARGEHFFNVAQHLLAQEKFSEAILLSRKALTLAPAHRDGRLLVARLRHATHGPAAAHAILLDGVPCHAADPAFLKPLLATLLEDHAELAIITLAHRLLADPTTNPAANHLIALAGATAAYQTYNYDVAATFLRRSPTLAASREGRWLAALIARPQGHPALSLLKFRELAASFPDDFEIHRELFQQLRSDGLTAEIRRTALTYQLAHPLSYPARLELIAAYQESGDTSRSNHEITTLIADFHSDLSALVALAEFAATRGDAALVARVETHAAPLSPPTRLFSLLACEAALVARNYQGALECLRKLIPAEPGDDTSRALVTGLQALAHFGLGEPTTAHLFLSLFLQQSHLPVAHLQAVAQRLTALGAPEPARLVLKKILERAPHHPAALTRLVELDIELNVLDELAPHLQQLIEGHRASPEILRVAERALGSDRALFSPAAGDALTAARQALTAFSIPQNPSR